MKKITKKEFEAVKPDEYGYRHFGNNIDFSLIKRFGDKCSFGKWCSFGERCSFGEECSFGKWYSFGEECSFGKRCSFEELCSFGEGCSFEELCSFGERCSFGEWCSFGQNCKTKEGIDIFFLANNMIPINGKVIVYKLKDEYGTFPYLRYKAKNLKDIERVEIDVKDIIIEPYSRGKIKVKIKSK